MIALRGYWNPAWTFSIRVAKISTRVLTRELALTRETMVIMSLHVSYYYVNAHVCVHLSQPLQLTLLLRCTFSLSLYSAFQLTMLVCWTSRVLLKDGYSSVVKMVVSMKLFIRLRMDGSVENARKSITPFQCSSSWYLPFFSFSEEGTFVYIPFTVCHKHFGVLIFSLIYYFSR